MLKIAIRLYRSCRFRPHCTSARHSLPCRIIMPRLANFASMADGPRCGDFDG